MGLVSQKIIRSRESIELHLQPKKKPAKLKTRKGSLGKSQGKPAKLKTHKGDLGNSYDKPAKLKTRKGGLGKNKGIKS